MFKSLFCAAALVTSVLAQDPTLGPAMNIVTKSSDESLNNQFVSINNMRLGLYEPARSTGNGAAVFNSKVYSKTGTLSLLVNGAATRQIILAGQSAGLLELREFRNAKDSSKGPTDATVSEQFRSFEWSVFALDSSSNLIVKDSSVIPSRQWLAIQDGPGLYLALWDGYTPVNAKYQNVTLQAVSALA